MKFLSLILFCVLCLFLTQCGKEPCNPENEYYALNSLNGCLPYTGSDSIWLEISDSSGNISDTCLFTSNGKVHTEELVGQSHSEEGCVEKNYYSKCESFIFKSASFPDSIIIRTQPNTTESYIFIAFRTETWKLYYSYIFYPPQYTHKYCMSGGNIYTDFITTGGRHPAFIDKNNGIIKLVTPYNLTFSLLEK